jgi:N-glycosidase YbiA
MIESFSGEHAFLSNFALVRVSLDNVVYPSVEHAYQAAKTDNLALRMKICAALSAARAKAIGKSIPLRADWNKVKLNIMLDLVRQKFAHKDYRHQLLATGDQRLVEGNWWGDTFWGVCRGKGENHLGRILMRVRAELENNDG